MWSRAHFLQKQRNNLYWDCKNWEMFCLILPHIEKLPAVFFSKRTETPCVKMFSATNAVSYAASEKLALNELPIQTFTKLSNQPSCTSPSVLCPGSVICVKPSQFCDEKKDCPDGSDEKCLTKCPFRSKLWDFDICWLNCNSFYYFLYVLYPFSLSWFPL